MTWFRFCSTATLSHRRERHACLLAEPLEARQLFAAEYGLTILAQAGPATAGHGTGLAINAAGDVVGISNRKPYLWKSDGTAVQLSTLDGEASAINDNGQIVGHVYTLENDVHPYLWTTEGLEQKVSVSVGANTYATYASAINNGGQIAGQSFYSNDNASDSVFFFLDDGSTTNPLLPQFSETYAYDINNAGQVVGAYEDIIDGEPTTRAFRWSAANGVMDVGSLQSSGAAYTVAHGINDAGMIVGQSTIDGDVAYRHAFLRTPDGVMQDLGAFGAESIAYDINAAGQIVGDSGSGNSFIYANGQMRNLNDLIDPNSGWEIVTARDINDSGQIVGRGYHPTLGHSAVLLTPGSERPPARSLNFDGKSKATFVDADGSTVIVSLKGPGSGAVIFDKEMDSDAARIVLRDTTLASNVTMKGTTSIRDVEISGSLASFTGKNLNLTNSFSAIGGAKKLILQSITNSIVSVGSEVPFNLTAEQVVDSRLQSEAVIHAVTVGSWLAQGGAGNAQSDSIRTTRQMNRLISRGDFEAGIVAPNIGRLQIGGNLGGTVQSWGDIQAITVGTITADAVTTGSSYFDARLPTDFEGLDFAGGELGSFVVKSRSPGAYKNTVIAAKTIGNLSMGHVDTASDAPFGVAAAHIKKVSGSTGSSTPFSFRSLSGIADHLTNNQFTIRTSTQERLSAATVDWDENGIFVMSGEPLQIVVEVSNSGTQAVGSAMVSLQLAPVEGESFDLEIPAAFIDLRLAPDKSRSYSVNFEIPAEIPSGMYFPFLEVRSAPVSPVEMIEEASAS